MLTHRRIWWAYLAVIFAVSLLAACASGPSRTRDDVTTVTVKVPVPVPCVPKMPPALTYPDTDEALATAPNVFEAGKLLVAGRLMRIQREKEYQIALAQCAEPVSK